jgi:hypothetical protein
MIGNWHDTCLVRVSGGESMWQCLTNNVVDTARALRDFETVKRRIWSGAKEVILIANEAIKVFLGTDGEIY